MGSREGRLGREVTEVGVRGSTIKCIVKEIGETFSSTSSAGCIDTGVYYDIFSMRSQHKRLCCNIWSKA